MGNFNNGVIPTSAGPVVAPWIEDRARHQYTRVAAGVASGQIDGTELQALRGQAQEARADLTASKADNGWVGPRERFAVHKDLNALSASIHNYRND